MIPRLTHSRISPLPSEVTICNSAKVKVPAFDAMPRSFIACYHALLCKSTSVCRVGVRSVARASAQPNELSNGHQFEWPCGQSRNSWPSMGNQFNRPRKRSALRLAEPSYTTGTRSGSCLLPMKMHRLYLKFETNAELFVWTARPHHGKLGVDHRT